MDQKTLKDDQNFQKSNSNAIRKRERKNISNSAISESFISKNYLTFLFSRLI